MKEYTAIYDTAKLRGIEYAFEAANDAAAVEFCGRKFTKGINITLIEDTGKAAGAGRIVAKFTVK